MGSEGNESMILTAATDPVVATYEERTDPNPTFEGPDEVGADPFMGPAEVILELGEALPPASATPIGLYGGTLENTCDPQRLVDYLLSNPAKGQAWAAVQGIAPSQLSSYILSLSPTVLAVDTAVINHSYSNGVAKPINAVLGAGTAVLVDADGVPRARCYCGNPLLPPAPEVPVEQEELCIEAGVGVYRRSSMGSTPAVGDQISPAAWSVAVKLLPTGASSILNGTNWRELAWGPTEYVWVADSDVRWTGLCQTKVCFDPHLGEYPVFGYTTGEYTWGSTTNGGPGEAFYALTFGANNVPDAATQFLDPDRCNIGCDGGDQDGDEVCDWNDNCVDVPNPNQADSDHDGEGDACDSAILPPLAAQVCLPHADSFAWYKVAGQRLNSGVLEYQIEGDTYPFNPSDIFWMPASGVTDSAICTDLYSQSCGSDVDADGVCDGDDNCVDVPNSDQANGDNLGLGDACDPDLQIDQVCLPHADGYEWFKVCDARWTNGDFEVLFEDDGGNTRWLTLGTVPDDSSCQSTGGGGNCGGWGCGEGGGECSAAQRPPSTTQSVVEVFNIPTGDPDGGLLYHTDPGLSTAVQYVLANGTPLTATGQCVVVDDFPWWEVEDGGASGWASANYLRPRSNISSACPVGVFDPTGKPSAKMMTGDFDGDGTSDTLFLSYDGALQQPNPWTGTSATVQIQFGDGGLSAELDIMPRLNDGGPALGTVFGGFPNVFTPAGSNADVAALHSAYAGSAVGGSGTTHIVSVNGCRPVVLDLETHPDAFNPSGPWACPVAGGTYTLLHVDSFTAPGSFTVTPYSFQGGSFTAQKTFTIPQGAVDNSTLC